MTRLLDQNLQKRLDPFLMLDAFGSEEAGDYIGGFPDHPHRGFETVTYMLRGRMRHRDSAGNSGLLEDGGVQWMSAARGVIHSEMPEQKEGQMRGFQLWINLHSSKKMSLPWYKDFASAEIPEIELPNLKIRLIAGTLKDTNGAVVNDITDPLYLDLHFNQPLAQSTEFAQDLAPTHNAFLYVYEGATQVIGHSTQTVVQAGEMAILSNDGDSLMLKSQASCKLILIAGKPLNEPIVQYGPFVMNTKEEILRAVEDFRAGRFAEQGA